MNELSKLYLHMYAFIWICKKNNQWKGGLEFEWNKGWLEAEDMWGIEKKKGKKEMYVIMF